MNAVELDGVTKTFGSHIAVDDLSLRVPSGSVYGFIGPNGSGKTTTLRMIMDILRPDRGSIRVLGESFAGTRTDRIGYMPEERGLYKKMRVREILEFYGELKNGRDVRQRVERWLDALDLGQWADKRVEALSKGMAQKVQFISTVVAEPELVVLDEPFSGLDPVNADAIKDAVLKLRDGGATVILSTHDMSVAERLCDFVFMIFKGRKVLDGTLASIRDEYGRDTIRVRIEGGAPDLRGLEGVRRVHDLGRVQELQLSGARQPQEIVMEIMTQSRVSSFELTQPSLHDIFVAIAAPEPLEVGHA